MGRSRNIILRAMKPVRYLLWLSLLFCGVFACTKDKAFETDAELYNLARETSGFSWYGNTDSLLSKSAGSGHGQPFLRTRYNNLAATRLDSAGKVMENAAFPEGSLIVKELFEAGSMLDRYAVLYKNSNHSNADAKGWVWGYINADGSVAVSASKKGNSCISCHSQQGNIDYMLMNKYFP
jgi:hypothetical protein